MSVNYIYGGEIEVGFFLCVRSGEIVNIKVFGELEGEVVGLVDEYGGH